MRGLIATTGLAAALLLAGCNKTEDAAANDSVTTTVAEPGNELEPDVDENVIGVPELGPGNDATTNNMTDAAKAPDDKGSDDRGSDDRGSDDR